MKTLLVAILTVLIPAAAFATPPGDLNLSFDVDKGQITVQGPHPTQEMTEHFIRRVVVVKNDEPARTFYYPRQTSASEFKYTIELSIVPGDNIHVEVHCNQGGSKAGDLVIPEASTQDAEPMDLKSIKDRDHETMQVIP